MFLLHMIEFVTYFLLLPHHAVAYLSECNTYMRQIVLSVESGYVVFSLDTGLVRNYCASLHVQTQEALNYGYFIGVL